MSPEVLYKQIRRLAIFLIGISIVLIGCILFFTPGPAIIVIPAGLALLATEFIWAKKLLNKFKEATSSISKSAKKVIKKEILIYSRKIVPNAKNEEKPITSVIVVRITPPPRAGSTPILLSIIGMRTPDKAAKPKFAIIAIPITTPIK